jgi:hypothetical protein
MTSQKPDIGINIAPTTDKMRICQPTKRGIARPFSLVIQRIIRPIIHNKIPKNKNQKAADLSKD